MYSWFHMARFLGAPKISECRL
uniref:Uncharacterized protein n=1 Tax=Arundo donax TaxID=35708 RepID=A0A0A9DSE6_ARUDO